MPEVRLAVVSDAVLPFHSGGKETRHYEIAKLLVADGYAVEMHTMRWWHGPDQVHEGVGYRALSPLVPMYRGERRSKLQALVFAALSIRMLFRRFDVMEADAVPVLQVYILRLVTLLRRRRLVVTWHEYWGVDYWRQYLGRAGVVAAALERGALRLADHTVCPSEGTAERIRAVIGRDAPISVVPNGIDLELILATPPSVESFDVTFVGRLMRHKNVDALLRGVARLNADGRPTTCRIIGVGPEEGALRSLSEALGLGDQVRFDGRIADDCEVIAALKGSSVFGFLSEREGFGVAAVEALACGLPVLAYDHPDNHTRHLLSDRLNARLVDELDPGSVAEALGWLLDRAPEMSQPARQSAQDFGWATVARMMSRVYAT